MKILLYDLETSPILFEGWSLYDPPSRIVEDWRIICFAYKWLGEDKTHFVANWHYGNPKNDKPLVKILRDLFDQADVTVAHNGDKFDRRRSTARFIKHNFNPPSPYKTIDTLKVARNHFHFTSNRLNEIAKVLQLPGKIDHHSFFEMWDEIKKGDEKTQRLMKKYNIQDVNLLEQVYLKLRPYMSQHPNVCVLSQQDGCPKCLSDKVQSRGITANNTGIYQRYYCNDCHSWFQGRQMEKGYRPKYKL